MLRELTSFEEAGKCNLGEIVWFDRAKLSGKGQDRYSFGVVTDARVQGFMRRQMEKDVHHAASNIIRNYYGTPVAQAFSLPATEGRELVVVDFPQGFYEDYSKCAEEFGKKLINWMGK